MASRFEFRPKAGICRVVDKDCHKTHCLHMATMNISLPDEMRAMVEDEVATGMYANASDFFRALLRDRAWRRDDLLQALLEGQASGRSDKSPEQIVDEVMHEEE